MKKDNREAECLNCESCGRKETILYEGWFRANSALNPLAKGTASAGLLQIRKLCKECSKILEVRKEL